jgi:uncharacterized membrane protein YgcG
MEGMELRRERRVFALLVVFAVVFAVTFGVVFAVVFAVTFGVMLAVLAVLAGAAVLAVFTPFAAFAVLAVRRVRAGGRLGGSTGGKKRDGSGNQKGAEGAKGGVHGLRDSHPQEKREVQATAQPFSEAPPLSLPARRLTTP